MPAVWAECLGMRSGQHAETDPKQPKIVLSHESLGSSNAGSYVQLC